MYVGFPSEQPFGRSHQCHMSEEQALFERILIKPQPLLPARKESNIAEPA
jgi:hypothetical protein